MSDDVILPGDYAREAEVEDRQRFMRQGGPQRGEVYLHWKGDLYVVLGRAVREDDLEDMVVYRNLKSGFVWTRPLKEWFQNMAEAGLRYRFAKMECKLDI